MSEECAAGTAHDSPPFPPFPRPPSYPLRPEHAQWAVERLANQIAPMRSAMAKKYSLELLEALLKQGLRQGRLPLAKRAVEAANKGDYIADSALRAVAAELQTALSSRSATWPQDTSRPSATTRASTIGRLSGASAAAMASTTPGSARSRSAPSF